MFVFKVSVDETKVISEALAERPYKDVWQLVQNLQAQINAQLAPPVADEPPQVPNEPPSIPEDTPPGE